MIATSGILAALLAAAPGGAADVARFALVVGHNASDDPKTQDLRYADDDAVATHRLLSTAGVESVLLTELDEGTRSLYPGLDFQHPTLDNLVAAMKRQRHAMEAASTAGKNTEFLFFYSGHGDVENGQGYVTLNGGRLTRSLLYSEILGNSTADRNHIFVDACKSYFLIFDRGPGGRRRPSPVSFVDRVGASRFTNTGFVLSTSSDRDSHEWEQFQAGVFSHEVRSALWGSADADGDGVITYAELGAFLTNANAAIPNERFRPDFMVRPPGPKPGDLESPVLGWANGTATLHVDRAAGHIYLENATGTRIVDSHLARDTKSEIRLPAQRPLFVRETATGNEFLLEANSSFQLSELSPQPVEMSRRGALHVAFTLLFERPFDAGTVTSFTRSYLEAGDPLDRIVVVETEENDEASVWEQTALWGGVGFAALGIAFNLGACEHGESHKNASQQGKAAANSTIRNLNTAAVISYAVAGAALTTWLTLRLWPESDGSSVSIAPTVGDGSVGISVRVRP